MMSGLAVVVSMLGLFLAGATAASAADVPPGFTSDGCTLVPEAPSGVSFHDACVAHDLCYFLQQGRSACDSALYTDMKQACNEALAHGASAKVYASCRTWAAVYYTGVRLFGGYFYNSTGVTRTQTPMGV
jgi:hypothetical protein